MEKAKPSNEVFELLVKVQDKIDLHQKQVDEMLSKLQEMNKPILELKDKIREKRKEIAPLSQLKASVASAKSRDKYFPDDTKKTIIEKAKKAVE